MIVRTKEALTGTDRHVHAPTFDTRRYLLKKDGMGFSFHETVLYTGTETYMYYKNHVEAVYCVRGHATLTDLATGKVHDIRAGTMYALDQHDKHILKVHEEVTMMCVFNPALVGPEVHDAEGTYPILEEEIASSAS